MTVPNEVSTASYVGNGVTVAFPTLFRFASNSEVRVKLTLSGGSEVIQTEGVHYTLAGEDLDVGGTVTMLVAPAVAATLVIERNVPFTQPVSFRTQGSFSPAVHEESFDESVFRDQQLDRRLKAVESAGPVGSVVAGNGLFFSGLTLHAGAGAGIQSNADSVEVLYGDAAAIANVTKAAASAGVANTAARSDHKHDVSVGAPFSASIQAGNVEFEGTSPYLSRSDHVHRVNVAAPVSVTKAANAAGSALTLARSDHKHDVSTAAPIDVTKAAAAEGTATSLARSDHKHDVSTAAAVAISAATAATEGTATTLARSDHTHSIATAAPVAVDKSAAAAGSASSLARSDHKHDVSTAAATTLNNTNAEGTATTLARSDHNHAHGNAPGGTLHAESTTAANGFASLYDKRKTEKQFVGGAQTTNATPSRILINDAIILGDNIAITFTDEEVADTFLVIVTAKRSGGAGAASFGRVVSYTRQPGAAATEIAETSLWAHNTGGGAAAWTCTCSPVNGSATTDYMQIDIVGQAATTINWRATVIRCSSVGIA